MVVRQPIRDAFAPVYANRRQMLIFTPLVAALLALGTWFVAGRLVRPVERLADAARRHAATTGHELDATVATGRDEATLLDHALSRLALTDPLTELANRSAVKLQLGRLREGQNSAAAFASYAVLLLNLDDFHIFNNTKGHEVGDQFLRAVAERLRQLVHPGTVVARLGGDEFVLILEGLNASSAEATKQAQAYVTRVLNAFEAPFEIPSGTFRCQASLGIAVVEQASTTTEEALTNAELAMQEAKRLGKRQAVHFDGHLQDRLVKQSLFEQELREAVPSQLTVLYQPQVNQSRQVIGAELLVRWNHPQHGVVSPARFIPVAEQTGLIVEIGRWVLEQACLQITAWQNEPHRSHLVLAVNVSAKEFSHPDYVRSVQQVLESTAANPARLKLELTESTLAVDVDEVVARMNALKALGVTFSLDDFGTGFSSLSYLKRMPIDQLKIDQSFVREMLTDNSSTSIVRTVVALGEGLGLQVIAEGVETEEQRQRLAELGCHNYQGYLFGRPMQVSEFGA